MAVEMEDIDVKEAVARTRAANDEGESGSFVEDVAGAVATSMNNNIIKPIKDIWGWDKRLPRNIGMGAFKTLLETTETLDDIMAEAPVRMIGSGVPASSKLETEKPPTLPPIERVPPLRTMFPGVFESAHEFISEVEANNTTADDITQGVAQFAIPFTGYLKAFGGLAQSTKVMKAAKALGAEAVTAMTAFDPHEGRFADLLQMGREMENRFGALLNKVAPDESLANAYIDYMTNRENEGEWEGRYKNAVDSLAATVGMAGLFKAVAPAFKAVAKQAQQLMPKKPSAVKPKHSVGATGEHSVEMKNVGEARAQEGDGILQMKRIDVVEDQRGTGAGMNMILRMIDEAQSRGLTFVSDVTVSPSAKRLYEGLKRRGYTIKENANKVNPNTGNFVSNDPRVPVFEVTAAPVKE